MYSNYYGSIISNVQLLWKSANRNSEHPKKNYTNVCYFCIQAEFIEYLPKHRKWNPSSFVSLLVVYEICK